MRSEVHKGDHHRRRLHQEHQHSKRRRQHESPSEICGGDISTVPPVPCDTSGSERYFPLSKEHCDDSGSESSENNAARKRRHRDNDVIGCEESAALNSDSDNVNRDEERAKQRKKHKHKEKKKRKHSKRQRTEDEGNCGTSHVNEESDRPYAHQQVEQRLVRVKQEPQSSDEETRRRPRVEGQREKARDRNGHSNNDIARDSTSLRPDRPIKEEPRDRSSSHERNLSSEVLRHGNAERRNGTSDTFHDRRDRRNGRVNGETSAVKREATHSSRMGGRDRRRRDGEQEGRSRERRNDSKWGTKRVKREQQNEDDGEYEWGQSGNRQPQTANDGNAPAAPAGDKKPNFGLSGKLTEDVNVYNGVIIKYSEPPEARKPKRRWRFYPFKGDDTLPTLYLHRQSAYLIGRDRKVADIPVDHPSCSKQHAALQYRLVPFTREDGTKGKRVRPYIIDLDSANGTFVNNKRIEPRKYVELMERDVVKFGYSSRDYVLLHEHSKGDETDDDQNG